MDTLFSIQDEKMNNSLKNSEKLIYDLVELSINEKRKTKRKEKKKTNVNSENFKNIKKEKNKCLNKKQRKLNKNICNSNIISNENADQQLIHNRIICDICEMSPIKGNR